MLTQKFLKEFVKYDKDTGLFTNIKQRKLGDRQRFLIGDVRCRKDVNDKFGFGLKGRYYYSHYLAVLYMTGKYPKDGVEHLDGDTTNNAWDNLCTITIE